MANVSQLAAVIAALRVALEARPGLANVDIHSAFFPDLLRYEAIVFSGTHETSAEWAATGRRARDEALAINGWVYVRKPGVGNAQAEAAMTRAAELLAELETEIYNDPTIGNRALSSILTAGDLGVGGDPEGVVCQWAFRLDASVRLAP